MKKNRSSRTAELAAMTRTLACHSSSASEVMKDPFSKYFMGPSVYVPFIFNSIILKINPYSWKKGINSVGYLMALCRHRFISDIIMQSIRENYSQVVILGAGYDTFVFHDLSISGSLQVFEIDHPGTQSRKLRIIKKRRLQQQIRTEYIPLDLQQRQISEQLIARGFNRKASTIFIAEGLIAYLSKEKIIELFKEIISIADNVKLVADYRYPQMNDSSANRVIRRWKSEFRMMHEKYMSFFLPQEMEKLLSDMGYTLLSNNNIIELWSKYSSLEHPEFLKNVSGIFCAEKVSN